MVKRNSIKKLLFLIFLLLLIFAPSLSFATSNELIDTNLKILQNGDGIITTSFKYNDNEGTEHFIVIGNLGDSQIKDLKVIGNEQEFLQLDEWDVEASFEEKSGKYGMLDRGDSYELCWGISQYGENTFQVQYRITNIVKQLNDYQILYWNFINKDLSEPVEKVFITIEKESGFSQEDVKMWAYGFDGNINLIDGKIKLSSNNPISNENYMTALLRLPHGYFETSVNIDEDFEYFFNLANEGSDYNTDIYIDNPDGEMEDLPNIGDNNSSELGNSFMAFFFIIPSFIIFLVSRLIPNDKGVEISKKKLKELAPAGTYHRELSKDELIEDSYYLLYSSNISNFKNYITAYFLKWILEERVVAIDDEKGFIFKKESKSMRIDKPDSEFESKSEQYLFSLLVKAAGSDRVLQEDEFSKLVSRNPKTLDTFIEYLKNESRKSNLDKNYIEVKVTERFFSDKVEEKLTIEGEDYLSQLLKFKAYLNDFSLLAEKESINVKLWDYYMIYAAIFGITDKVEKEFKKLYPNYIEESNLSFSTIYWANIYANNISRAYTAAHDASSPLSSGGFGGGSSLGGGGGSFGGGSGGGTR